MSSGEGDLQPASVPKAKRVKAAKACDLCRQKKIRCDAQEGSGSRCSYCVTHGSECTFGSERKRPGRPNKYVESLQKRLKHLEDVVHNLRPDIDLAQELDALTLDSDSDEAHSILPHVDSQTSTKHTSFIMSPTLPNHASPTDTHLPDSSDDEELDQRAIRQLVNQAHHRPGDTFLGKSSAVHFVHNIYKKKYDVKPDDATFPQTYQNFRERFRGREEFWSHHPYMMHAFNEDRPIHSFPVPPLITHLVDIYFNRINPFLPLLHRPTFERALADNLHFNDSGFGSVLLLVCANAARYSDDPRAFDPKQPEASGWVWFNQVTIAKHVVTGAARLHDLQIYALAVTFLKVSVQPQACWGMVGLGIRLAVDAGVHRRKTYKLGNTPEGELWKRAFWILVLIDRQISCAMGRPFSIQEEDMDVDYPVECDDEYWDVPGHEFEQPPGKPSYVSAFIQNMKLTHILAFAMRTIYSIGKSKALLGLVGDDWQERTMAQLDSALNSWKNSLPTHLQWHPNIEEPLALEQSAYLYTSYYLLQIIIHRPFITPSSRSSPLFFPSLAICTSSARSSAHLYQAMQRRGFQPFPQSVACLWMSGIVLFLNLLGSRRSGRTKEAAETRKDAQICLDILDEMKDRWPICKGMILSLEELANTADNVQPVPSAAVPQSSTQSSPSESSNSDDSPLSTVATPEMSTHYYADPIQLAEPELSLGHDLYDPQSYCGAVPQQAVAFPPDGNLASSLAASYLSMPTKNEEINLQPDPMFTNFYTHENTLRYNLDASYYQVTDGIGNLASTSMSTFNPMQIYGCEDASDLTLSFDDAVALWSSVPNTVDMNSWATYNPPTSNEQ
ncbi:hypothetical protein PUNSTDRAFT_97512 [Punctularia strigosozonata HHB-11173 SS5]|uniref:uncharacterized protein n=1 Tax=Punctularia strigosozonata (strain HHB-11173) TaxID=741275 RepID=UPI00044179A6|nr:uncharacterized protein PUNSTDRAFT_97512 [Punctularia strigosozonata HHB-11173 SS5]EIN12694.1 hypothetical protein PUNSTDRAFT_97512 [Punctularia strigosozonata HHB-11173 SS5]